MIKKTDHSRHTMQRDIVLAAARKLPHPTAEDVYREAASAYPGISKATVYRNLNVLAQSGALLRISSPGSADHFDNMTHRHYHALCRRCGRVFDVEVDGGFNAALDGCVRNAYGFRIEKADLLFSGVCCDCLKEDSMFQDLEVKHE